MPKPFGGGGKLNIAYTAVTIKQIITQGYGRRAISYTSPDYTLA